MRKLAIAAVVGLLAAACGTPGSNGTPPEEPGGTAAVTIVGLAFDPANTSVTVGTTVTWTNDDSLAHTVTFDGGPDSGNMATGATFQRTFTEAGTFNYHCSIHPSMTGTVNVGN